MPIPEPDIDTNAFHALMAEVSTFGATAAGGVHRLACSAEDGVARDWLRGVFAELGLRVVVDPIGNLFGVLDWAGADAPTVMTGSHLDSQPNGGRFDGAYGVVAACAAVAAIRRHVAETGATPRCNLVIADWTNEEGARFQPSLIGSAVYAGQMELERGLACRDGAGISVGEALGRIGYLGSGAVAHPDAYIEIHIECTDRLEAAGERFGAFVRYWGATKYRVAFLGEQAHTGPTPMQRRKDALLGAAYLIADLRALADRAAGTLYTSVGRLEVVPNSPNVVPGEALVFAELRSPDAAVVDWAEAELAALITNSAARAGVAAEVRAIDRRRPGAADPALVRLAADCAASQGVATMELETIAGHDAISLMAVCPAIVVAVPSVGGICHNPAEFTAPEDLALGAQILTRMLWRYCTGAAL